MFKRWVSWFFGDRGRESVYFGARKKILKHAVTPFPEMETMKADGKEFLVL